MMDGPEYKCMELTTKCLRMLGSWPKWHQIHRPSEKIYVCYGTFVFVMMLIYMIILTYGLIFDSDWGSSTLPIEEIIVYSTGFIVTVKIMMIALNQKKLQETIDYINLDLNKRHIITEDDRNEILKCVKHEKLVLKLYVGSAALLIVLFLTSSILKLIKAWNDNYDAKLPLKYPFRIESQQLFIIAYTHQFIVMIVNGEVGTLADALFTGLVYYICGHLRMVQNRYIMMDCVEKKSVEYHIEVISLVDKVERIFRRFLLFMFSVDSFLICLGLLQVTHAGQASETQRMSYGQSIMYLSIKLTQLFLYCWYGQEVKDRSGEVAFACYSTNWYTKLSKKNTRLFLLVLARAQKPLEMRAGPFFSITVHTVRSVMHSAYSFFTMLNSLR